MLVKIFVLKIFETKFSELLPAKIMSAAPTTGARAAYPGKLVEAEKARVEKANRAIPARANSKRYLDLIRDGRSKVPTASRAPTPNSHALVRDEK